MPTLDTDMKAVKTMFEVNFFSIITTTTQAFNPSYIGVSGASKAAQAQMTNCLRCELVPFGITVIHVRTIISFSNNNDRELCQYIEKGFGQS